MTDILRGVLTLVLFFIAVALIIMGLWFIILVGAIVWGVNYLYARFILKKKSSAFFFSFRRPRSSRPFGPPAPPDSGSSAPPPGAGSPYTIVIDSETGKEYRIPK